MNDVAISNDPNIQTLRSQIEKRLDSFAEALPSHITPEQFKAVLIRAAMADPKLLTADRVSFFEAALAAAIDGLMPDKKEGAMVIYRSKIREGNKANGKEIWIDKVQWMPMIRGIFTKVYNTGLVKSATVGIVYGGDQFRAWTDDEGEHLFHEEADEQDRNIIRRVYAQVVMKAGGCFVDTMRTVDIEKVRRSSKSPDSGPWKDWWEEMAFKTVFRHLSKRLPFSRDVAPVLDRDNFLYDLATQARDITPGAQRPRGIANRLDALVGIADQSGTAMSMEKVETREKEPARQESRGRDDAGRQPAKRQNRQRDEDDRGDDDRRDSGADDRTKAQQDADAFRAGRDAREKGMSRKAIPAEFKQDEALAAAWLEGFDEGE